MMKILFWGTYDKSKPRVRILLQGLKKLNVTLYECHFSVWEMIKDKSQISSKLHVLYLCMRLFFAYPVLIVKLLRVSKPDVIIVAYPAIIDILFAAVYSKLFKVPLVCDVFISLYNTIVEDRRFLDKKSFLAKGLFTLERFALRRADQVIFDTDTHAQYVGQKYGINKDKLGHIFVGVESHMFPYQQSSKISHPTRLLFYGQFIPLHGIENIIQAARKTTEEEYSWTLIGLGQEADKIAQMLKKQPLGNLNWISWVDYSELITHIQSSDICLGIFGNTVKTQMVIPNKVFQIISAGKPFVTLDTPAMRELFPQEVCGLQYSNTNSPDAILQAVEKLKTNFMEQQGELFCEQRQLISSVAIARSYMKILTQIKTVAGHNEI